MRRKILTLDELVNFCATNNLCRFSAKETGYQLAVQIPATFEEVENEDETMMYLKAKLMHTGRNRNGSNLTEKAAKKLVKQGFAYKPILANFTEDANGDPDFTSHDFFINDDDEVEYIEHQVGCFTTEKPYLEQDPKREDRQYIFAQAAIPIEYTKTAEIIKRKNGSKLSAELCINEMSYDSKERVLLLDDVILTGATLLGVDPVTKDEIGEGMEGARVDEIKDFSQENNSLFNHFDKDAKMIELLESIDSKLSNLKIDNSSTEGGLKVNKLTELLDKYNKKIEDINFEYENLTDEELEAKFAELFDGDNPEDTEAEELGDSDPNLNDGEEGEEPIIPSEGETEEEPVVPDAPTFESATETTITVTAIEGQEYSIDGGTTWQDEGTFEDLEAGTEYTIITRIKGGDDTDPSESSNGLLATTNVAASVIADEGSKKKQQNNSLLPDKYSITMKDGSIREFALSLQDQIAALTILVNDMYAEADNCWYDVLVYDKNVVMSDWWAGKAYRQDYKVRSGVYSLVGDRVSVHSIYVTDDEEKQFDELKSNFAAVSDELDKYHKAEEKVNKEELMSSEAYKSIFEKDEYKEINIDEFSLDSLTARLDEILLKYAKEGNLNFSSVQPETGKKTTRKLFGTPEKRTKKSRYGGLFKTRN